VKDYLLFQLPAGWRGANHPLAFYFNEKKNASGYKVIEAEDGIEALALLMSKKSPVDLVVLDVLMPFMGGTELDENISKLGLNCKKLFVSGYSQFDVVNKGYLNESDHFLQKPFSTSLFAQKVRQVLNDGVPVVNNAEIATQ